MADEVGMESLKYHTHIYIVSKHAIRMSTLQHRFSKNVHLEAVRGNSTQNRAYVFKQGKWLNDKKHETALEDTQEEWGEIPIEKQGVRNDLAILYDMIKEGLDNFQILENSPEHILRLSDIERARQVVKENEYRNIFRKLDVTYIFGKTSSGKTRYVMEKHLYQNVFRVTGYKHPFDGYRGQPVICFDEYRSNFEIQELLCYLDGYPLELPCRYSNKIACYNTVYIISNIPLRAQYLKIQTSEPETYNAFIRRINKIIEYQANGTLKKITN